MGPNEGALRKLLWVKYRRHKVGVRGAEEWLPSRNLGFLGD